MKNIVTKMKTTIEGTNRIEGEEEWVWNLEDEVMASTQTEQEKKNFKK